MKRFNLLVVGLLGFVMLINSVMLVSADNHCADDQIILRLSGTENAHGALYDDADYSYKVCYEDVFGESFDTGGANPHSCVDNALVLRLSGNTNAHAEDPALNNYNTEVCYGDLSCTLRDACQGEEKAVVSLSSSTNAHLASGGSDIYTKKLCCSTTGGEPPLPGEQVLEWQNFKGEKISEAGVGWKVRAVLIDDSLDEDTLVTLDIIEDDGLIGDDSIKTIVGVPISEGGGKAVYEWEITQTNFNEGTKKGLEDESEGEFYFIVNIDSVWSEESNILTVRPLANEPPTANIVRPKNGQIYCIGDSVTFEHDSMDKEGPIVNAKWDLGDGTTNEISNENQIYDLFTHSYSTDGVKLITLSVEDEGGLIDGDRGGILVLGNTPGVFPFIDKPEDGGIEIGRDVDYSGVGSYAVEVKVNSDGALSFECFAGKCPAQTTGCGGKSIGGSGQDDFNLNKLFFEWSFFGNEDELLGTEGDKGKVSGTWVYENIGKNSIELLLTALINSGNPADSSNPSASVRNEFDIVEEFSQCFPDSPDGAYWVEEENGPKIYSKQDGNCVGPDGVVGVGPDGNIDDCCPSRTACVEASPGDGHDGAWCSAAACVDTYEEDIDGDGEEEVIPITSCFDYNKLSNAEEACNDCVGVGDDPPEGFLSGCEWFEDTNTCAYRPKTPDGGFPRSEECTPKETRRTECVGGEKTIYLEWGRVVDGVFEVDLSCSPCGLAECPNNVPCANVIQLPFFGIFGFLAIITIIGMVYYLNRRKFN